MKRTPVRRSNSGGVLFWRGEIVVPDLLLFEIANALRYNPSFSTKEIQEALDTLFGIGIGIITPPFPC